LSAILPYRFVRHAGVGRGVQAFELPVPQDPDRICLPYPPTDEADPASLRLRALVSRVCSPAALDAG
jgi:DNA-binding transcriptional LysR family regulator